MFLTRVFSVVVPVVLKQRKKRCRAYYKLKFVTAGSIPELFHTILLGIILGKRVIFLDNITNKLGDGKLIETFCFKGPR